MNQSVRLAFIVLGVIRKSDVFQKLYCAEEAPVNFGGSDLAKAVKKMLEACITNNLACSYTLFGKKMFRGNFSSLQLYRVIQR